MALNLSTQDLDVVKRATHLDQSMVNHFLADQSNELRSKIVAASYIAVALGRDDELRDPFEDDPKWVNKIHEAGQAAAAEIKFEGMGRCHMIWKRQAEMLKEKYQISWYSPAQMNPWMMFD
jgi:hypothetical protein